MQTVPHNYEIIRSFELDEPTGLTWSDEPHPQVAALRLGVTNLNERVRDVSKETNFPTSALRPILMSHRELREVCAVLNMAYGPQMLLATVAAFFEITYCVFYFFSNVQAVSLERGRVYYLAWSLLQNAPVLVVMNWCQKTENEVRGLIDSITVLTSCLGSQDGRTQIKHTLNQHLWTPSAHEKCNP